MPADIAITLGESRRERQKYHILGAGSLRFVKEPKRRYRGERS
jgi:hypothetical protein